MKFLKILGCLIPLSLAQCNVFENNAPSLPSLTQIRAVYLAANPNGLVPGLTFTNFTMPACTVITGVYIYHLFYISDEDLRNFLDFSGSSSRIVSPEASSTIPSFTDTRYSIHYECETDLGGSNDMTFFLNDMDEDTLTDATEYPYRFTPLLTNMGVINVDSTNIAVYRGSTSAFKIPSGISTAPLSLETVDASTDNDGDDLINSLEITNGTNFFVATSGGTFATGVDYTVGSLPFGIAMGDLTNDGNMDLLVANFGAGNVSLVSGNGDGTFNPKLDFTTGSGPVGVNIADFDADGEMDFVVANSNEDTLSIFLAATSVKVDYATGDTPYKIAVGDFDGDNDIDLAVTNFGNSITGNSLSVLLNAGNGTFGTKVDYTTGNGPYFIVTADFNEDGDLDLAVTNFVNGTGNTLSVLIGNGDGTFDAKVDYTTDTGPSGMVTGDFDNDGNLDLAVADTGQDNNDAMSILMGNGDGTFDTRVDYTTLTGPSDIKTFDLEGDGDLDIVVAHFGGAIVPYTNNGSGVFTAATGFAANSGGTAFFFTAGDLDADGDIDLVSSNFFDTNVSVFLNE